MSAGLPALPAIPASLQALMTKLGPVWAQDVSGHVRCMVDAFSVVLAAAPKAGMEISRDVAYGPHPRQALDVYQPDEAAAGRDVLVFVHGGAFVDGNRDRSDEVYSNVLHYFARHGLVGVNIEYRLAPACRYPGGSEDVALALDWVRTNIACRDGKAQRIFLMGHSAGAAHTGSYVYDTALHPADGPGVAGHIVISGRVRADTSCVNPNAAKVRAYYGDDPAVLERGSPVNHVGSHSVPTMIAVAEYENPLIDVHCAELFHRLAAAKGRAPRFVWLEGHNHTSSIAHLNTADERLGREILAFIRSGR